MTSTQQAPHTRLHNIQALRGLAALLVMLSHLLSIDIKYSGDPLLPAYFEAGMGGVDIFFVISGFIMVYVTQNRERWRGLDIIEFLYARITRIYPLYWFVSFALLAVYLVKPELVFSGAESDPNIIKSFLLWPDATLPLLQLGWTLIHEMGFYVIFAGLLFLGLKKLPYSLGLWAVLVLTGHYAGWRELSPELNILFHPLSLEFIAGAYLGLLYPKLTANRLASKIVIMIALIGLLFSLKTYTHFPVDISRVVIFGTLAFAIVTSAAIFEKAKLYAPKPFQNLGDWSYSLYLTHILTLSLLGRIWEPFAKKGIIDNIIALTLISIAAIIVAAITYYVFERPMLQIFRKRRQKYFGAG